MKCKNCKKTAEYHLGNFKLCYDHTVNQLGYNPGTTETCFCCSLIDPGFPRKNKKRIEEIESRKKFNGEQSPYWNHIQRLKGHNKEGDMKESAVANPDILSEDDHIFHRPLSKKGEFQFQVIRNIVAELSSQQQKVLQLHGFDGLTLRETAKELELSVSNVHEIFERAKAKILERYQELQG